MFIFLQRKTPQIGCLVVCIECTSGCFHNEREKKWNDFLIESE